MLELVAQKLSGVMKEREEREALERERQRRRRGRSCQLPDRGYRKMRWAAEERKRKRLKS